MHFPLGVLCVDETAYEAHCDLLEEETYAAGPASGRDEGEPVSRSWRRGWRTRPGRSVLLVIGCATILLSVCATLAAARLNGSGRALCGQARALVLGRTTLFQAAGAEVVAMNIFGHAGDLLDAEVARDQQLSTNVATASTIAHAAATEAAVTTNSRTTTPQRTETLASSLRTDTTSISKTSQSLMPRTMTTTTAIPTGTVQMGILNPGALLTTTLIRRPSVASSTQIPLPTSETTTTAIQTETVQEGVVSQGALVTTTLLRRPPVESASSTQMVSPTSETTRTATQTKPVQISIIFPDALLPTTTLLSTPAPPSDAALPAVCDVCSPPVRDKLTVVIPVWEHDLCKLKVTAKSIDKHDLNGYLGDLLIVWVSHRPASDYEEDFDEIKALVRPARRMEVHELIIPESQQGWYVQQSAKLKVASLVTTTYYLVLDAKNALIRDLEPHSFFDECNLGKIFGRYSMSGMPGLHHEWYSNSAKVLGTTLMETNRWPASITPVVMHRETVLELLEVLGEPKDELDVCTGGLCDALGKGATEFTLYLVYVGRLTKMECIHSIEDALGHDEIATSIWRGDPDDEAFRQMMLGQLHTVAQGDRRPLIFGAQAGALDTLSGRTRYKAFQDLYQIYLSAGLYDFKDWDELAECVVGI